MAEHPDGRRRHRLDKMTFDEISFVDRGMNQHAAVLFWKRDQDAPPTDEEIKSAGGKAFHLPGQASSAADCPEGWEFDAANRRCVRKTAKGSHLDREGESAAERRRRLRREARLGPRSRQASQTGFLPTGRQLLQQRLTKRKHYTDCTCKYCVANK